MKLIEAIKYVDARFVYETDKEIPVFDHWSVMKHEANGKMYGDCDDFFATTSFLVFGLWGMIFAILTGRLKAIHCTAASGGGHVFGEIDGVCWDNWTRKALRKEEFLAATGHTNLKTYNRFEVLVLLFVGLFFRSRN